MKKLAVVVLCLVVLGCVVACSSPAPNSTEEADLAVYSIFYYLDDGEVEAPNPVSYNSLTPTFTLSAAARKGYRFIGWSRSADLSDPELPAVVEKGTTGNLSFYAVYVELYSIRVDSAAPEFYTVEYVSGPVAYGETATVRIYTAEPVSALEWWGIGTSWQAPDECEYDEALGCFVARFVLTKNATVMVAGVL